MNIVLEDIEHEDILRLKYFIRSYPWRETVVPEEAVDIESLLEYILQTLEDTEDYSDNQMELSY